MSEYKQCAFNRDQTVSYSVAYLAHLLGIAHTSTPLTSVGNGRYGDRSESKSRRLLECTRKPMYERPPNRWTLEEKKTSGSILWGVLAERNPYLLPSWWQAVPISTQANYIVICAILYVFFVISILSGVACGRSEFNFHPASTS